MSIKSTIDASLSASAVCDAKGKLLHSRTELHDISVHKQLEQSLRDSETRFRAIIDASPIPYALNDEKFNITYLNAAFTHTFGYTLTDIPTVADWWPLAYPDPAYRQRMVTAWQINLEKAEREQAPFEPLEADIQCRNGDIRSVLVAAAPLSMSLHDLHVVTFFDITERKQAEEALRKSETSFRNFFEINTSVMLLIDPVSGIIISANAAAVAFYGYPQEQIVGMSISEINAMSPERIAEEGMRALREECNDFHFSHRLASGEVRDVEVHLTPIDSGGRPLLFSIIHDITERTQAEVKLRLAATVFTHAREGIMITRVDGTIIDVNETFSHITGYSRDEVLGRNPHLLSSGRHNKKFFAALWESLLENGHWYGEIWNRRKNGEVFAEMLTISAVSDTQGITQQYVALFSDITPLKEHEKQLEHIAHYDALTALPNRVLLADRMRQAMVQALRREQRLAVIYLDIDGFKAINDNHGHETGDRLLMTVSKHMKQALREGDTLARLGGDEFVAVLPDLDNVTASETMLNRLLAAAAQPFLVGDLVLNISISLGITFYPQAEETDTDQLLRQADQAMYQAKLAGKNCYRFFQA
jgi:diguanylate cyclase (GGDEF)-like protein/PAS domain S-box-containing protein